MKDVAEELPVCRLNVFKVVGLNFQFGCNQVSSPFPVCSVAARESVEGRSRDVQSVRNVAK